LGWLLIPLAIFVLKRFYSRKQHRKEQEKKREEQVEAVRKGIDSPFYLIEEKLSRSGYGRRASETLTDWLTRIETVHPQSVFSKYTMTLLTPAYLLQPRLRPFRKMIITSRPVVGEQVRGERISFVDPSQKWP